MNSTKFFDNKIRLIVCLLFPAFLLYYKSFKFGFTTLDEQWLIVHNADLMNDWKAVTDAFKKSLFGLYYRPLLIFSVFLDFKIAGVSTYVYHVTNVLLHLMSVLLLYKFLRMNQVTRQISFFCTLVFSVHPILLHAVAWVPGRNDSLLFIFIFASIISLLQYFKESKRVFIALHYLFFICALLTKETAFVLPVIFIALYFIHKKAGKKEFIFLFIFWFMLICAWLMLRNKIVEVPAPNSLSMPEVIANFFPAMLLYTGKALFPVNQSVLPWMKNASVIPGLIAVAVLVLLWLKPGVKDKKIAGSGLFIFFTILALPVWFSASRPGAEHYEHRLYAAMPGLMLFVSQLKFGSFPGLSRYLVIIVLCLYSFKTYTRMEVYRNKENFVDAGVKECPGNYLFLFQKSEILFNHRDFLGALDFCNQAIQLRPDKHHLYSNRGVIHYQLGYYKSAVTDFNKALEKNTKQDYGLYLNRAVSYEKSGDIRSAYKDVVFLKQNAPNILPAEIENVITDKWISAGRELDKRIEAGSADAKVYYERAQFRFDQGRHEEGLADLSKACALEPGNKLYLKDYMSHFEQHNKK